MKTMNNHIVRPIPRVQDGGTRACAAVHVGLTGRQSNTNLGVRAKGRFCYELVGLKRSVRACVLDWIRVVRSLLYCCNDENDNFEMNCRVHVWFNKSRLDVEGKNACRKSYADARVRRRIQTPDHAGVNVPPGYSCSIQTSMASTLVNTCRAIITLLPTSVARRCTLTCMHRTSYGSCATTM